MPILRGMDSETADLIYLDPPFNSGKLFAGENFFWEGWEILEKYAIMAVMFFMRRT